MHCAIVTHLSLITYIVKPMATLIITRRLYLIASLQSVELPTAAEVRIPPFSHGVQAQTPVKWVRDVEIY